MHRPSQPCPCGSDTVLAACCGPLLAGVPAATAEQLMRSRYSAYALDRADHLVRTWHPRTRPGTIEPDGDLVWEGLEITEVVDGGEGDEQGVVAFRARWRSGSTTGEQVERSRFVRRGGRWTYLDGDTG